MLTLDHVTIVLSKREILRSVSLHIPRGAVTIIIGANGAGKSTLLRAISGEMRPARGRIILDGRDLARFPAHELAARRAVMPQATQLGFPFRVEEVVGLGASVPAVSPQLMPDAVATAMQLADVSQLRRRLYTELSGGERQRVHFARALCQLIASRTVPDDTLLLLDEPTSNLDLPHQMLLMERARVEAARGRTVVAVLHDLNLAAAWGDGLIALAHGQVAAVGAPAEVLTSDVLSRLYDCAIVASQLPGVRAPVVLPQALRCSEFVDMSSQVHVMASVTAVSSAQPAESQPCD